MQNIINVIGEEMYFRNNNAGIPTLIHFIDYSMRRTYCGFSSPFAESVIGDDSDSVAETQCCKRCLKNMLDTQQLKKIQSEIRLKKGHAPL